MRTGHRGQVSGLGDCKEVAGHQGGMEDEELERVHCARWTGAEQPREACWEPP